MKPRTTKQKKYDKEMKTVKFIKYMSKEKAHENVN